MPFLSSSKTKSENQNRALWIGCFFSVFLSWMSISAFASEATAKPNILIFMADDLGWNDVGYHGSEIRTPNIDALAANAVRLEQFYVMPWCSATRAAFETGINPARFGMRSLEHRFPNRTALPPGVPTLPELLRRAGYFTALLGKWHLSYGFTGGPLERGYSSAFGYLHGQLDHYTHENQVGVSSLFRDAELVQAEGHMTDLIASELSALLDDENNPFFINVTFSAPHYPLQSPSEFLETNSSIAHPDRRNYAAMVTHMDAVVGATVDLLRDSDQFDNTIIVFFSDNGGDPSSKYPEHFYDGEYGPYEVMADNNPLRGGKSEVYEGGIRVPAFIHFPKELPPATLNSFSSVLDLLPTLVDFAGGEIPADRNGDSLRKALRYGHDDRDAEFLWFTSSIRIPGGGGKQDAIRSGHWKLIETQKRFFWLPWRVEWPWPNIELFNLSDDPGEAKDLSDIQSDVTLKLRKKLRNYREQHFGSYLIESTG